MAKSPVKSTTHLNTKATKAPGKTILPRHKFQKQRRFSIIDSDSSSELSEFSDDDDQEQNEKPKKPSKSLYNHHGSNHQFQGNKFHAIESESEDGNGDDSDHEGSISANEQLWKNHHKQVVNTSSTSSEGEEEDDDDDDSDSNSSSDSSSSDDEDVDFVKLTAERKAKALQHFRSTSPFKDQQSPSKDSKAIEEEPKAIDTNDSKDVDFSFNFNNDDHQLRIANEEEEDVGEELNNHLQDYDQLTPNTHGIPGVDELPHPTIESSESDDDIDKDELLRTLEQDSDGVEGGGGFGSANDDEYDLLQQEADNILHDYNNGEGYDALSLQYSSSNPTPRNSVVEEMINKHKSEMNQEEVLQFVSDDDYASDDDDDDYYNDDEYHEDFIVPFFDDSAFKEQLYTNGNVDHSKNHQKELDSDDDSYLWDYFFSSGDENDEEVEDPNNNHYSDDEATDEDTTLPPPSSRKKVGAKAQELLSSSSVTARPPALGTWSTDSKPFGIIDGLSTRSLIPNSNKNQSQQSNASGSTNPSLNITTTGGGGANSLKQSPSTPLNNNNIEELTLDELLNMSELEDDDNDEVLNHEDWLEATESTRKVPLSAFRNKGIVNDDSHINATRRFSPSSSGPNSKKSGKKHGKKINEITMTPVRVVNKQHKQRRKSSKLRRRQSMAEAAVEGLRVTKSGLFSEDTLTNVEEFLSGLGSEAELNLLFREVQ
ncbi:Midasin [Wickerhamomyces ciferrii]|uniref:Midasin n=1 Tax=Wickerhamomyces ciferrii (strain ATCC 14091 / BCRC 22168 / CBS 111 / JCM 3599 / NBRC 0793 / NRRL Y-1031 F-60-10) TaxID=1206466 RepID=K0KPR5_WICCF|nr:Midasin [Wickerhamomyces ciferrii]CCH45001.1 Midasin [Wickerhamomyces ciferrii]